MAGALSRLRVLLAAAALVFAGCGGDGADSDTGAGGGSAGPVAAWVDPDGEEPLVGSLAVDPEDRALWLSTNRGLYRVDGARPEQVTGTLDTEQGRGRISAQLVVGFDSRERLIASGHPDTGTDLPQVLGLLRSEDRGRTWESVSQLGTSDFHVLEHSGPSLVAAQYGDAQVMVSSDDGRTWSARTAPAVVVDLAVDPRDLRRWVATTADGVFHTGDGGGTWRPSDTVPHVRLAWAGDGTLYRLDPDGVVRRSSDGGESWDDAGSGGPEQAQALAADGKTLYAATADGAIARSTDGGGTFEPFVRVAER